jgi:hypothetical protein
VFKLFWKKCIKGITEKEKLFRHTNTMVSTGLMIFYYLFLYMLRNQLDVINCTETNPPDGNSYNSFTSPSCGGLCKCWEEGGLQMSLAPAAILTFFVYSVGFAFFIYYTLKKHRNTILEDQYLRAQGYGDESSRLQLGDTCYQTRKRFSRIYYHFRPEYYYWILLIIGRKTAIALTSLLYRKNPSLQFAVALLAMFSAYVLQVKYKPYMSPSQFSKEVESFRMKAVDEPKGHYAQIRNATDKRLFHLRKRDPIASRIDSRAQSSKNVGIRDMDADVRIVKRVSRFNVNYNTVESTLLGCSVFVCLAGICFENADAEGPYKQVRQGLTWLTLGVVSSSIIYFMGVLVVEVAISKGYRWATTNDGLDVEKETAGLTGIELSRIDSPSYSSASMQMNPLTSPRPTKAIIGKESLRSKAMLAASSRKHTPEKRTKENKSRFFPEDGGETTSYDIDTY